MDRNHQEKLFLIYFFFAKYIPNNFSTLGEGFEIPKRFAILANTGQNIGRAISGNTITNAKNKLLTEKPKNLKFRNKNFILIRNGIVNRNLKAV